MKINTGPGVTISVFPDHLLRKFLDWYGQEFCSCVARRNLSFFLDAISMLEPYSGQKIRLIEHSAKGSFTVSQMICQGFWAFELLSTSPGSLLLQRLTSISLLWMYLELWRWTKWRRIRVRLSFLILSFLLSKNFDGKEFLSRCFFLDELVKIWLLDFIICR